MLWWCGALHSHLTTHGIGALPEAASALSLGTVLLPPFLSGMKFRGKFEKDNEWSLVREWWLEEVKTPLLTLKTPPAGFTVPLKLSSTPRPHGGGT